MNTPRINIELLDKVINQELNKADVIKTCHPLLAGGGGVTVLTRVVTFVLAPQLPAHVFIFIVLDSPKLPVSVTNIPVNARVVIDVPGPEFLFKCLLDKDVFAFLSSDGESGTPSGKTAMKPSSSASTSHLEYCLCSSAVIVNPWKSRTRGQSPESLE